jgi:hypothetical protein
MTKEQFELGMKEIAEDYRRKKEQLQEEFALSNNTYKMGNVFTDHIGRIKILEINWDVTNDGIPCCVYEGVELKSDGFPKKSAQTMIAWQCNEKK